MSLLIQTQHSTDTHTNKKVPSKLFCCVQWAQSSPSFCQKINMCTIKRSLMTENWSLSQTFGLQRHQRVDTTSAQPLISFSAPSMDNQESLCSQSESRIYSQAAYLKCRKKEKKILHTHEKAILVRFPKFPRAFHHEN